MARKYEMHIGGKTVAASAHQEIKNPATGTTVGMCPVGTVQHLNAAVDAAAAAFPAWRRSSDAQRRAACEKMAEILTRNASELATLVTQEQGKPLKGIGSEFELGGCAAWTAYTATLELNPKVLEA